MRRCPCWGIRLRCVYSGREHGRRRGGRERESRVEHRGRVGIIYLYAPKFLGYGVAPEVGRRLTRTQLCSRAPVSSAAIDSARSHHSDRIPPSNPATIRCAEMAHTHPRALRRQRLERNVSKHVACWADGICSEQIRKTQMHLAAAAARRAGAMAPSLLIAAAKGDTGAGRTGDQGVEVQTVPSHGPSLSIGGDPQAPTDGVGSGRLRRQSRTVRATDARCKKNRARTHHIPIAHEGQNLAIPR